MDWKEQDEIISRVIKGDRNAYTQVVNRYKGPIFNLAYRMTGSYHDADDLTQETFLKAYAALGKFRREKKFFTWLYTISLNLIRNHLRGAKPVSEPMEALCSSEPGSDFENPEGSVIRGEEIKRLDICMRRLSPDVREAVVLRFHQGLAFEDIAAISGCSLSGAKMKVYRGLERLRLLMDETIGERNHHEERGGNDHGEREPGETYGEGPSGGAFPGGKSPPGEGSAGNARAPREVGRP